MSILWLKAIHIFFMVAWFAGIFYLPRLFVYHAETKEQTVKDVFKVMERRLWFFVLPFAILTLVTGVAMMHQYGAAWLANSTWLHPKITLVSVTYLYYGYLYVLMKRFANDENKRSPKFYRFLNEAPVLVLLGVIILAVVKPIL